MNPTDLLSFGKNSLPFINYQARSAFQPPARPPASRPETRRGLHFPARLLPSLPPGNVAFVPWFLGFGGWRSIRALVREWEQQRAPCSFRALSSPIFLSRRLRFQPHGLKVALVAQCSVVGCLFLVGSETASQPPFTSRCDLALDRRGCGLIFKRVEDAMSVWAGI